LIGWARYLKEQGTTEGYLESSYILSFRPKPAGMTEFQILQDVQLLAGQIVGGVAGSSMVFDQSDSNSELIV
jgi:hypothetical protein